MTRDPDAPETELDPLLQDAIAALRTPVPARHAARAALREAVRAGTDPSVRPLPTSRRAVSRRAGWLTTARTVRVSPLGLLAAASLLVATTALVTRTLAPRGGVPVSVVTAAPATAQVVRFSLAAPEAHNVALVGDFNGWDPAATSLQQQNGTWTVVIPVTPGRHQYGFVIDGATWIADPQAARSADADFGTPNSVVYVGS